ncbi:MAG: hypothetical protein ACTSYB_02945, partial [Candidatus Helarchaeota archaeon]
MPKKKKSTSAKPKRAKPKKWGVSAKEKEEHAERDMFIEEDLIETIRKEVPKMKMITPSLVAQKFNVRISIVKKILRELAEENKIKTYIYSNRLKVYV